MVPALDPEAIPIRVHQRNTKLYKSRIILPEWESDVEEDNDVVETESGVAQASGSVAPSTTNLRALPLPATTGLPADPNLEESDPED